MVPHNTYQFYWNTDAENTNAMHLVYGVYTYMATMVHTHQVRCVLAKHEKMYMSGLHVHCTRCKMWL